MTNMSITSRAAQLSLLTLAVAAAGALPASAQDQPSGAESQLAAAAQFVGTPSVRYAKVSDGDRRFYSLAAVVRLDRSITPQDTGFPVAPGLSRGDEIGSVLGGSPAGSIGERDRHCYSVELQRPRPAATPQRGARWRLGLSQSDTVIDTVGVTLKPVEDEDWQREAAERLGCVGGSDSDEAGSDELVGRRVTVKEGTEQLLVNKRPNEVFVGSLQAGETFKVRKLSASGKYAYGFAYGNANKLGWVRTSALKVPGASPDPAATWPPANSGCGQEGPTKSSDRPTVELTSATLGLRDSGRVRVNLRGNQTAATTVSIAQVGGKRVGGTASGTYTCTTPTTGVVSLPVNEYGRTLVRRHGKLEVKLTFRLINGSGVTNTVSRPAVIRPTR